MPEHDGIESGPTLFWGLNGDQWDTAVVICLVLVVIATYGQVVSHGREASSAKQELEVYKSQTERQVAQATQKGIDAGRAASDALSQAATIQLKLNETEIALAVANRIAAEARERAAAAEVRLEKIRAPRQIKPENISYFRHKIRMHNNIKADIMVLGEGPEPMGLARQISNILFEPNSGWTGVLVPWTGGGVATGVAILLKSQGDTETLNAANDLKQILDLSEISSSVELWPGDWTAFGGFTSGPTSPEAKMRIVVGTKPI